jgi:hypothetical protein
MTREEGTKSRGKLIAFHDALSEDSKCLEKEMPPAFAKFLFAQV